MIVFNVIYNATASAAATTINTAAAAAAAAATENATYYYHLLLVICFAQASPHSKPHKDGPTETHEDL